MRAVCVVLLWFIAFSVQAAELSPDSINVVQWRGSEQDDALLVKTQVLLDRAGFSPGEIDGRAGENYKKALSAFAEERGIGSKGEMTEALWQELSTSSQDPVIAKYTLSDKDVAGPFLGKAPTKLEDMKGLKALSYGGARERIAERFHMSEELLSKLNPGQKFERAGNEIYVAQVADQSKRTKAAKLEVDKTAQTLRAFDKDNKLIAFYPITAGSTEKPAPIGELKIRNVARNPTYRYNPEYGFKGVRAKQSFTVAPGPNNPVGLVWIGLPGEGYGIHGTCVYRKLDSAIAVMEAAQNRLRGDGAAALDRTMKRGILLQRSMGPRLIIIGGVRAEDPAQMRFTEHDHVVEAFPSDRADKSLNVSILPG